MTTTKYFGFVVDGHKELMEAFAELPKSLTNQVIRDTMKKAVQPVAAAAKALVARDEQDLMKSITVGTVLSKSQRRKYGKTGDIVVYVGPSQPRGSHGHLVEFGTRPRFHKKTGKFVGIMPAKPFMRPAWDATRDKIPETIGQEIWDVLKKVARRVVKRAASGKLSRSHTAFFGR